MSHSAAVQSILEDYARQAGDVIGVTDIILVAKHGDHFHTVVEAGLDVAADMLLRAAELVAEETEKMTT